MSIKGFSVGGVVQRYDYTALDNLPQGQGVSDDLKAALLQLAQKVAYIDDQGQTYYDDLYDALYPEKTLLSIAANFQQGQAVVYNTDSLDSLKQYLTVTATYDDASTETVPSSAYTLSGTLTTGTSVITVTYEGKTDAFNVVVTAAPMALTVTNNLTGCITSNSATSVLENTSYTAVITASSGYTLVGATVSITMGGNDITTSAYSGGIITINSVTGALVISVAAVAAVLNSISAVYTQSGTVYDTDTLDSLKADLVVTAHYSDSSTQTVPAADYTLSGTLTAGTSIITVSYGGKTTTFNVTVTKVYDFLTYIESDGNCYIDTQVVHSVLTKAVLDYESLKDSGTSFQCPIGSVAEASAAGRNPFFFFVSSANGFDGSMGGNGADLGDGKKFSETSSSISSISIAKGSRHTFTLDSKNESVSIDQSSYAVTSGINSAWDNPTLYLFARNNLGNPRGYAVGRLYSAQIYEDDVLVASYLPARRVSDNVYGLYESVSETFLTASGSGSLAGA